VRNVIVTGVPRSGTSWLASVFVNHGFDPGRRAFEESKKYHAKVEPPRWEDPWVLKENNQSFSFSEGHPMMPPDHVWSTPSPSFVEEVLSDKKEPWVIKDPGFCFTLPMWMELDLDFVVCATLRHPWSCVKSLNESVSFPESRCPKIWWRYMINLVGLSCSIPVNWVSFPEQNGIKSAVGSTGCTYKKTDSFHDIFIHNQPEDVPDEYRHLLNLYTDILTPLENREIFEHGTK